MKCHSCGNMLKKGKFICSSCGYNNLENMPISKEVQNEIENTDNELTSYNNQSLVTIESLNYRKKIFITTAICGLIMAAILLIVLLFTNKNNDDYMLNLESALQKYYETYEVTEIEEILQNVKTSSKNIKEVQNRTREVCNKWINEYFENEVVNVAAFEEVSIKYEKLIYDLNQKVIVTFNNEDIKILTDEDLQELLKKRKDIYDDGLIYYEGIEHYNNKDFNQSYEAFLRVIKDNLYYNKALLYENKIISDIIDLLKNDINKLTSDIDKLSDEEKLKIYDDIYNIIIKYDTEVYQNVNLGDNSEYKSLLNTYQKM